MPTIHLKHCNFRSSHSRSDTPRKGTPGCTNVKYPLHPPQATRCTSPWQVSTTTHSITKLQTCPRSPHFIGSTCSGNPTICIFTRPKTRFIRRDVEPLGKSRSLRIPFSFFFILFLFIANARAGHRRSGWPRHLHQHRIDGEPDVCGAKLAGTSIHHHLDAQQSGWYPFHVGG